MLKRMLLMSLLVIGSAMFAFAQKDESSVSFNASALPRTADSLEKFTPSGWMVEEAIKGDLNNDSVPDAALKLIEKPPADADKDNPPSRERALLILFKNKDGAFERVAAAKTLLQCTRCGGAFYGMAEAPADIKIAKGVLILRQDGGSRNVTETTFRFRYDPKVKKFALIGYDVTDRDRATGETTSESVNYLTGNKITETFQYNKKLDKDVKTSTKKARVSRKGQYIEDINYENFDGN